MHNRNAALRRDDIIWGIHPVSSHDDETSTPLVFTPARLPDPATILPRQWLLGTQLLKGFVTVLVAPGGTGKSIYAMTAGLSLATKKKLLDLHVWQRVNVAIINEDPMEELERRLAAIMIRHKIDSQDVVGRYFLNSMDDRLVRMAERGPDGYSVVYPDEAALIDQITEHEIGLLVIDPFAESHSLEENSNPDMIAAARAWRRVARTTGCSILLVHHVRKGAIEGSIEAARGAKGLTDSARVGLLMQTMTADEAAALNIPVEERFTYIRVDDGKVNLSPRIDRATWFRLEQVMLGNTDPIYQNGDTVAAIVPWSPPKLFSHQTPEQISLVLDHLADGPEPGVLYGATARGRSGRWAGDVIRRHCDVSESQAQAMIDAWLHTGLLFESDFRHPATRKNLTGVRVDDSKRPT